MTILLDFEISDMTQTGKLRVAQTLISHLQLQLPANPILQEDMAVFLGKCVEKAVDFLKEPAIDAAMELYGDKIEAHESFEHDGLWHQVVITDNYDYSKSKMWVTQNNKLEKLKEQNKASEKKEKAVLTGIETKLKKRLKPVSQKRVFKLTPKD